MIFRAMGRAAVGLLAFGGSQVLAQDFLVPISANSPHVFMSLTQERDSDDTSFFSVPNAPPLEEGLPANADDYYEVAVFDTGSPATVIDHQAFLNFGIADAGRAGSNVTELGGVGPSVSAVSSDPLGVYAVGFDALLTNPRNGQQTIDRSQLRGTINDSILYGPSDATLPNLIGTTTSSHYTTVIDYGDPRIIEFNGETYRSPAVSMLDLGNIARPSRRIGLSIVPGQLGPAPTFFPDISNLDDLGDNPTTPTIAGSFWLTANLRNNGKSLSRLEAILDTGAQGSFVSEQIAAEMGFDVENDKPDFVVRIAGVTGVSEEVPGFYADEFELPGTDGGLVLKDVPLIVFNLTDPRDGVNQLDALIGMNLFSSRELTLNPEPGNAYLGVSDPSQPFHSWASQNSAADWASFQSWTAPGVPAVDWYADVRNVTGQPQIASVTTDSRIGMLVTSGHQTQPDGTMTVVVEQDATLAIFGNAILQDGSTIHLDNAALASLAIENRAGTLSGVGTIEGEVLSQGEIIPGGPDAVGTLTFPGSLDQLSNGVLSVELGDSSDRSNLQYDRVEVAGAMSLDGRLEIFTTDLYAQPDPGSTDEFTFVTASEIIGGFAEYGFNGVDLEREFPLGSDRRAFRDHIDVGQFLTVSYLHEGSMAVQNYQAIPGDADGDGEVTFDDFIELATYFGLPADWTQGDFDGDGESTFDDFVLLSLHFGNTASAAATSAVPEPSAAWLATVGILLLRRRR